MRIKLILEDDLMNCGLEKASWDAVRMRHFISTEYVKVQSKYGIVILVLTSTDTVCRNRRESRHDGSRNSWRGDARPRAVRQALPSPAQPQLLLFLPILFLVCFSTAIYTFINYEYDV